MALITCPECKKIVSDQAFVCPNCGNPVNAQVKNVVVKTIKTITEIARNLFSIVISLVILIVSIGILTYFSIQAIDYFTRQYLQ